MELLYAFVHWKDTPMTRLCTIYFIFFLSLHYKDLKPFTSHLCTRLSPSSLVQQIGFIRWQFIHQQVLGQSGRQAAWQEPHPSPHQSAVGCLFAWPCLRLNGTVSWNQAFTFHPRQEGKWYVLTFFPPCIFKVCCLASNNIAFIMVF